MCFLLADLLMELVTVVCVQSTLEQFFLCRRWSEIEHEMEHPKDRKYDESSNNTARYRLVILDHWRIASENDSVNSHKAKQQTGSSEQSLRS